MQLFKDLKLDKQYKENGYVICDALSTDEAKSLLQELTDLRPNDDFFPNNRPSSNYHCTFLDTNEDYKRKAFHLFKKTFTPVIDNYLWDYQLWSGNFYVKQPNHGKFEIHQNWTHVLDEKQTTFTIWCPLVDTSIENGTIQIVPKSHKIVPDIATIGTPYYFSNFEEELLNTYLKPIPLKAGQCIIFEDGLIHYSDTNRSKSPRYAAQILIGPKDTSPLFFYSEDNYFEVYKVTEEFWLNKNYTNMNDRPIQFPLWKKIPNKNQQISEKEFIEVLKNGEQRRKEIYK